MRVYIPGNVADLQSYLSGTWEPSQGYAVTPLLLQISAYDDQEELAEQARDAAATDSVIDHKSPRRLVVVVDYPRADVTPTPEDHPAAVALEGRVMLDTVACAFVDEAAAIPHAKKAAKGDLDALANLEEHQLLWFDATELDQIDPA